MRLIEAKCNKGKKTKRMYTMDMYIYFILPSEYALSI